MRDSPGSGHTILIVEANDALASEYAMDLEETGNATLRAVTSEEALGVLRADEDCDIDHVCIKGSLLSVPDALPVLRA